MRAPTAARRFDQFEVMGTVFSFDVRSGLDAGSTAPEAARSWLREMDEVFSTYRPSSAVNRLVRKENRLDDLPPEVGEVLALCAAASERTGGWFSAQPGGRFDPSGMVKGWAIDGAAALLRAAGARDFLVNGGGDVVALGRPDDDRLWRIGIADPFDRRGIVGFVDAPASGCALATSGTAARGGHVLDPFTGRPALGVASVSVLAATMTEADMLATTALAMGGTGLGWLERQPGVEALVVGTDGARRGTEGWPGRDTR